MKRVLRLLAPLLILALSISGFIALKMSREAPVVIQSDEVVWRVDSMVVTPNINRPQLTLYGVTEAATFSEIKSTLSAEVTAVPVHEGQRVEEGGQLVELDSSESLLLVQQRQAEIDEINAQIELEEIKYRSNQQALRGEQQLLQLREGELERIRRLKKGSMISESAADQALQKVEEQLIRVTERQQQIDGFLPQKRRLEAQREQTRTLLSQTRLDLQKASLHAPYGAIVHQIPVAPGERVRAGDIVASLYDPNSIEIRAQLPRTSIQLVRSGLKRGEEILMSGSVDGIPLQARLERLVSRRIDEVSGIDGIFVVTERSAPLLPGRALQFSVTMPEATESVVLPYEALYENNRIYRIDSEGRLEPLTVSILGWGGAGDESQVVIHTPLLTAGERVVTTHLPDAMKGLRVEYEQ